MSTSYPDTIGPFATRRRTVEPILVTRLYCNKCQVEMTFVVAWSDVLIHKCPVCGVEEILDFQYPTFRPLTREESAVETRLDTPDSPGWWAFDGYIQFANGKRTEPYQQAVRVFWGSTTNTWQVVWERGHHPAYMLVGKWVRLTMPWEKVTP